MSYDFKEALNTKKYGGSGKFFKFEEGENKIRILALAQKPVARHFVDNKPVVCIGIDEGCPYHDENDKKPSIRYPAYIVSRKDNAFYQADLAYSIVKFLRELNKNDEWDFKGFPMEFDITVNYDPDAAPNDVYKCVPSPRREPVVHIHLESLGKARDIDELADEMRGIKSVQVESETPEETSQAIEALADTLVVDESKPPF